MKMNNNNSIEWICYLMISNHMWDDEFTPPRYHNMPPRYNPENINDMSFWDEIIKFLAERKYTAVFIEVGDGVVLDKHPEIAAPNAWSKAQLKEVLKKFHDVGIKTWPRMDFSTAHDTWTKEYRYKLCSPEYYQFVGDVIDEICEIFETPYCFDIVMDEENYANQVYRGMARIRHEHLYWHDVHFMIDRVEKNGVRASMAADYFWHHEEEFARNVPKTVLVRNWYYEHFRDWPEDDYNYPGMHAYRKLEVLGYDQLCACSTWLRNENPEETVVNVSKTVAPERLKGFVTLLWCPMDWDNEYYLKNDIHQLYLARKKHYPETLN